MKKLAVNGMGRIGRAALKIILYRPELDLVAVNDIVSIENVAYLIKYDSVYGIYEKEVSHDENNLIIDGKKINTIPSAILRNCLGKKKILKS